MKKERRRQISVPPSAVGFAEKFLSLQGKPLKLFDYQKEILRTVEREKFAVICLPKRCGKSLLAAVLALHKALTVPEANIIVLSTSREHASSVCFRYIYRFTSLPSLEGLVEHKSRTRIDFVNGTVLEAVPCTVEAVAGRGLDLLVVDELALIEDEEVVQVAMSQTEKAHACTIITSTASEQGHLLHRLYEQSKQEGSGICFIYLCGEEATRLNPMITEEWLRKRKETMPEAMFAQYHLNYWGVSAKRVFLPEVVRKVVRQYPTPLPLNQIGEVLNFEPKGVVVAVGIDRALPHSKHADLSAGVVVARAWDEKQDRWLVLDCVVFPTGEAAEIKFWLQETAKNYPLACVVFETYQAYDLHTWACSVGLPSRLESATAKAQSAAFQHLIAAIEQGKLLIPQHEELVKELEGLEVAKGKYQAGKGYHDDCVYALLWAFYETLKFPPITPEAVWV